MLLNSENELSYLLELIVKEGNRLVGADRTSLFLVDEENKEVYSEIALGLEDCQIRLPLGRGVVGMVAFTGEVVNIENAQNDLRHAGDQFNYRTQSMLTVPLRTNKGKIIGVVQALNKKDGVFERRDEEVLSVLCDLAAVAIERVKTSKEQQKLSEQLIYQACHDTLTGLPNRVWLEEKLDLTLLEAQRKQHMAAVLFVDLDRFKLINNSLGHSSGDLLLQQVAYRLDSRLRFGDVVARQGGDEFVVVLPMVRNKASAIKVAGRSN